MDKILIIEDDIELRETLTELLEISNYSVIIAQNGIEGYTRLKDSKPDLVICDVNMPLCSGFELFEKINTEDIDGIVPPFIFLSAITNSKDIIKGLKLGAEDFITKPFEINDLLNKITRKLESRENLIGNIIKTERQKISRELHDGIQQILAASLMGINASQSHLNLLDNEEVNLLESTKNNIKKAIKEVRIISKGLSEADNYVKFDNQINDLIDNLRTSTNIDFNNEIILPIDLLNSTKHHIFRIIQELLTNILKYAKANEVNLSIFHDDININIKLSDNGIGFDHEKIEKGNGLINIESRLIDLNGEVVITSISGKGTTTNICIPLEKNVII